MQGLWLAGEIEAIGKSVKQFHTGDKVYSQTPDLKFGDYAEYARLPDKSFMALIPSNLSYEEAIAIIFGGVTALFFLKKGNIREGNKIWIFGASGAVGSLAVEIAKYYGAIVTGICSTTNIDLIKSLGTDKNIDYMKEDYNKSDDKYDFAFDVAGKTTFSQYKVLLKQKGIYLGNMPDLKNILKMMRTLNICGKKIKGMVSKESVDNLNFFIELIESGKLKPITDRSFPL